MEGNEGELHFDNGYYNALLNEDWEQVCYQSQFLFSLIDIHTQLYLYQ